MGESRMNPNSDQYRGELPDVMPSGELTWIVAPTAAFLEQVKELRAAGVEGPMRCEEKDQDAVLVPVAVWTVPLKTSQNWPQSKLQMGELARMPLLEFKKLHKANFVRSGMHAAANTIPVEDEKKIEV